MRYDPRIVDGDYEYTLEQMDEIQRIMRAEDNKTPDQYLEELDSLISKCKVGD